MTVKSIHWRCTTHSAVRAVSSNSAVGRELEREDLAKLRELVEGGGSIGGKSGGWGEEESE